MQNPLNVNGKYPYIVNSDSDAFALIQSSQTFDAAEWIAARPEKRRIGEHKPANGLYWMDMIKSYKGNFENMWVSGIKTDDNGAEFATIEIYELPKNGRKGLFRGFNIRMALSHSPCIEDCGQKYIVCNSPSAEQVEVALNQMKNSEYRG